MPRLRAPWPRLLPGYVWPRPASAPSIGDSEDAYGRTLAYVYLDTDRDGSYEHLFNEDLIRLGLARTTTFSHAYRREFERLREEAEKRGAGLWSACPSTEP